MASTVLKVVATVQDNATTALRKISRSLKDTGDSSKKTGADFTEFNRTLFSTAAFMGVFIGAVAKLNRSLNEAAQLDRVERQFERVFGSRGVFFEGIQNATTTTIDQVQAMKNAISISSLGIIKDSSQIQKVLAQAGTAAKMAGLGSAEGMEKFTTFLKDGSVASLDFLNIISSTNPALQAQLAILNKIGGTYGTVLTTQHKLKIGLSLLEAATKGQMHAAVDLRDIMERANQSFTFFGKSLTQLIGTALGPLILKTTVAVDKFTAFVERITKNNKEIIFFIKNMAIAVSTISTMVLSLGTLRLAFMALSALGISPLAMLLVPLTALSAGFMDLQKAMSPVMDFFKKVGAVALGVFQLVTSFFNNEKNFGKGIGLMDKQLSDFLEKMGLKELTVKIARAFVNIGSIVKGFVQGIKESFEKVKTFIEAALPIVDKFLSKIPGFTKLKDTVKAMFTSLNEPVKRSTMKDMEELGNTVAKVTLSLTGLVAAWKALKSVTGMIPDVFKKVPELVAKQSIEHVLARGNTPARPLFVQVVGGVPLTSGPSTAGGIPVPGGKPPPTGGKMGGLAKVGGILAVVAALTTAAVGLSELGNEGLSTEDKGTIVGGSLGTAVGGLLGALLPGIGAILGPMIGALVGSVLGETVGGKFAELFKKFSAANFEPPPTSTEGAVNLAKGHMSLQKEEAVRKFGTLDLAARSLLQPRLQAEGMEIRDVGTEVIGSPIAGDAAKRAIELANLTEEQKSIQKQEFERLRAGAATPQSPGGTSITAQEMRDAFFEAIMKAKNSEPKESRMSKPEPLMPLRGNK